MLVKDLMHFHPVTIQRDTTVLAASELMQKLEVRHLPVLQGTRLVGVLSDRETAPLMTTGERWADAATMKVSELIGADPVLIGPRDSAREAADRMSENRVGALPVVDDERVLVGILSYVDLLRALVEIV